MAKKAIELRENPRTRAMLETKMRYDIFLFGRKVTDVYFNMRGYLVTYGIPQINGRGIDIGEKGISAVTREIAVQNKMFEQAIKNGETKEIAGRRLEVLRQFSEQADLGDGYTEIGDWKHVNDDARTLDDDYHRDLVRGLMKYHLHISFHAGTAIIESAKIDGVDVDGGSYNLFPFRVEGVKRSEKK